MTVALGFGKYLSRFMHLFSEEVRQSLHGNSLGTEEHDYFEIALDSHFNANLRPQRLLRRLTYPFVEYGVSSTADTKSLDLTVKKIGSEVILCRREDGKRVVPLDLGFLSDANRPALFRLLRRFGPAARFHHDFFPPRTRATMPPKPVTYLPRIVYEAHVVLSRRQWRCAPGSIPTRDRHGIAEYMVRLGEWVHEHGIPRRVFAKLHAPPRMRAGAGHHAPHEPEGEILSKIVVRRDDRKPQLIDFCSPLLVDVFERLAQAGRTATVILEEPLPDDWSTTSNDAVSFHSEALIELVV